MRNGLGYPQAEKPLGMLPAMSADAVRARMDATEPLKYSAVARYSVVPGVNVNDGLVPAAGSPPCFHASGKGAVGWVM